MNHLQPVRMLLCIDKSHRLCKLHHDKSDKETIITAHHTQTNSKENAFSHFRKIVSLNATTFVTQDSSLPHSQSSLLLTTILLRNCKIYTCQFDLDSFHAWPVICRKENEQETNPAVFTFFGCSENVHIRRTASTHQCIDFITGYHSVDG